MTECAVHPGCVSPDGHAGECYIGTKVIRAPIAGDGMAWWLDALGSVADRIKAMPPHVVRIDAPSAMIAALHEALPPGKDPRPEERSGPDAHLVYGYSTVRLVENDRLGPGMIVYHMSDGTIRVGRPDDAGEP